MDAKLPQVALAEHLAERIATLDSAKLPAPVRAKCDDLLIDVIGLCLTARNEDYVKSARDGCDDDGPCTAVAISAFKHRQRGLRQRHRGAWRGFRRHV